MSMAKPTPTVLLNDFRAQWRDIRSDAIAALERVGESGWLILGDEVRTFEEQLARFWDAKHAVGCANGLDALEIALRVLGLRPGDKVLTTPLSAFATTLAIVRAGGVPVFVDIDESGLIDLSSCAAALERHRDMRHFVPVHLYGHAVDAAELERLRSHYDLALVEDCAQAIGAKSGNRPVGTTGQIAATSFYPTKNLGAMGDGGALLCSDDALAETARTLRDYGQSSKYVHSRLGMNSRLDELQAAIMRSALLPRLSDATARRRVIAQRYRDGIHNTAVRVVPTPANSASVWHLFPVRIAADRDGFRAHLQKHGVASGIHYPQTIPDQPALADVPNALIVGDLTHACAFAREEVSLPMHPYLTDAEVDVVIKACNTWRP